MNLEYIFCKILKKLRGKALLNVKRGRDVKIYSGCHIVNTNIGDFTYCSYDTKITNAQIGKFCSRAGNVTIGAAEHPISWISTSPVFENVKNSGSSTRFANEELPSIKTTNIGNDVWIGAGAMIKQGVTIGNGSIIAAMAMVTKDVPPYAIVAGVPAKVIKYRFEENIVKALQESEWWNFDDDQLRKMGINIRNPELFIKTLKEEQSTDYITR